MRMTTEMIKTAPKCCSELLMNCCQETRVYNSSLLKFSGVDGHDVYNISRPFEIGDRIVIAGRVEKREVWADSKVLFFEEKDHGWTPVDNSPILKLEDAFATKIGEETVLGGVEVYTEDNEFHSNNIGYRTVFYKGKDLSSLERFAMGPDKMKDIRLIPLANGKIGICTRPQGGQFGKGKIGTIEIDTLEEMTAETCLRAKIIDDLFAPEEWGGANELHLLENGTLGVLGHIAYEDEYHFKHYYAMSFIYDPASHEASSMKIIARREDFPPGEFKKPELEDVVFPGGLIRNNDKTATIYAGLSDAQAGYITIDDPFVNSIG